jgi:hypothetical protein
MHQTDWFGGAVQAVIRVPGRLLGMGREADCVLAVWKESSQTGRTFTRCKITDEPFDLPDGSYNIEFAGHTVHTRKWWGSWMLTFLPQGIDLKQAA